jgi:hypothetical protein
LDLAVGQYQFSRVSAKSPAKFEFYVFISSGAIGLFDIDLRSFWDNSDIDLGILPEVFRPMFIGGIKCSGCIGVCIVFNYIIIYIYKRIHPKTL